MTSFEAAMFLFGLGVGVFIVGVVHDIVMGRIERRLQWFWDRAGADAREIYRKRWGRTPYE